VSCHICRGIEFQAVGLEIEKARSASLVRVLRTEKVWVLLMVEHRRWDVQRLNVLTFRNVAGVVMSRCSGRPLHPSNFCL